MMNASPVWQGASPARSRQSAKCVMPRVSMWTMAMEPAGSVIRTTTSTLRMGPAASVIPMAASSKMINAWAVALGAKHARIRQCAKPVMLTVSMCPMGMETVGCVTPTTTSTLRMGPATSVT